MPVAGGCRCVTARSLLLAALARTPSLSSGDGVGCGSGCFGRRHQPPLLTRPRLLRPQAVDQASLSQGEEHEYCLKSTGGPLSIMLVWYDPPASPAAQQVLVNDLDLQVGGCQPAGQPGGGSGG